MENNNNLNNCLTDILSIIDSFHDFYNCSRIKVNYS